MHPYEYMDDWEGFNEALLPEKEDFYSHLSMEDITDANNTVIKRHHDLCDQIVCSKRYIITAF